MLITTEKMESLARDLMTVRSMIAELQEEEAGIVDLLKAGMSERGAETYQGNGWRTNWTNYSSKRFDAKAFKADYPDMYDAYTKTTEAARFTINV